MLNCRENMVPATTLCELEVLCPLLTLYRIRDRAGCGSYIKQYLFITFTLSSVSRNINKRKPNKSKTHLKEENGFKFINNIKQEFKKNTFRQNNHRPLSSLLTMRIVFVVQILYLPVVCILSWQPKGRFIFFFFFSDS